MQNSMKKYLDTYDKFMSWREENGTTSFSENTLLEYFDELKTKYQSSTLTSIFSMLKTTLVQKQNVNIAEYFKLHALLKKSSVNYVPKQSKSFLSTEVEEFINQAQDEKYLLDKVVLIIGVTGACRKHELFNLKRENVEDLGDALLVKIPETKTSIIRTFTIRGNFYKICKTFMNLRPSDYTDSRFFVNYQKGRCIRQPVGINKIAATPKRIAEFLNLPNPHEYTGHCFRRTSTTLSVDDEGDLEYDCDSSNDELKCFYTIENAVKNESDEIEINEPQLSASTSTSSVIKTEDDKILKFEFHSC